MDNLQKVRAGQKLRMPAATFNTFIDTVHDVARLKKLGRGSKPLPAYDPDIVLVKYTSSYPVVQGGVLGIDGVLFGPAENLREFKHQPCLQCSTPAASHAGRFVILLTPTSYELPIGRGVVSGVVPVQVNFLDASHGYADLIPGDSAKLMSAASGPAEILWKPAGTGVRWCLVRLGKKTAVSFWARITDAAELSANQWAYGWTEVRRTASGWEDVPSGRAGTNSAGFAINSIEAPNDGVDLEGNSVDRSLEDYPAGFHLQPVAPGAVVRVVMEYLADGTPVYTFAYENAEDGPCEAP